LYISHYKGIKKSEELGLKLAQQQAEKTKPIDTQAVLKGLV
jgi:hypothetical protein